MGREVREAAPHQQGQSGDKAQTQQAHRPAQLALLARHGTRPPAAVLLAHAAAAAASGTASSTATTEADSEPTEADVNTEAGRKVAFLVGLAAEPAELVLAAADHVVAPLHALDQGAALRAARRVVRRHP